MKHTIAKAIRITWAIAVLTFVCVGLYGMVVIFPPKVVAFVVGLSMLALAALWANTVIDEDKE